MRFTIDGSDDLERSLSSICDQVAQHVRQIIPPNRLEGLLLAGGYGRGEGGVMRTAAGDKPYNDMEFYLFVAGSRWRNERQFGHSLHALTEKLSAAAGIDIEIKLLSLAKLRRSPPSMFYYDLVAAHRWIIGDDNLLTDCEHHRDPTRIPAEEATRLLMNRCSGLLFAGEKLEQPPLDSDFIARNIAKAQLALGDAVLTVAGQYHWSCRERNRRLHNLDFKAPNVKQLHHYHDAGVEFKLHPVQPTALRAELLQLHSEIVDASRDVWLWLENTRLNTRFATIRDYTTAQINRYPNSCPGRNLLANLRAFGPRAIGPRMFRDPRERILISLASLLWTSQRVGRDVSAYRDLWRRFN